MGLSIDTTDAPSDINLKTAKEGRIHAIDIDDVTNYTMKSYYTSQSEKDPSPLTGYCIPVEPEDRHTASPTGGVIGRPLVKDINKAGAPFRISTKIAFAKGSPSSCERGLTTRGKMNITAEVTPESHSRFPQPVIAAQNRFMRTGHGHPATSSTAQNNRSLDHTKAYPGTTHAKGASAVSSQSSMVSARTMPLHPEDMDFLMKKLEDHINRSKNRVMTRLVPVHEGRPGQHILRVDPITNELFACIPGNPYAPQDGGFKSGYALKSYDGYLKMTADRGRKAKEPYPAAAMSSLNTCDHCGTPKKALNNDVLCPFHAYYLATGRFLGYYQFCALVELEKIGVSLASGWWTLEGMVEFVAALTQRIEKWIFLKESDPETDNTPWEGNACPYGAIGEQVPSRARGKSAVRLGKEQAMSSAVGFHSSSNTTRMSNVNSQLDPMDTFRRVMARQSGFDSSGMALCHVLGRGLTPNLALAGGA